jgi:hypothetical protein
MEFKINKTVNTTYPNETNITSNGRIKYRDIMDLGFIETFHNDDVYFDEFGYQWSIVEKRLTKKISLDWSKDTQKVTIIRSNGDGDILAQRPIDTLQHLKDIIEFYINDDE